MKRKVFLRCTSVILTLCMVLSCMTFAFTTVGAATVDESSNNSVSAMSDNVDVSAVSNEDKFSWDNASVYFLMTDRFKNGNTSNDHSYNRGLDQNGNVVTGIDTRGTFHGGDFAGVTETINDGYFNDLGINAIWISAPYEQIHGYVVGGNENPSYAHYSYHGYYVLDYTQTDANFGTAEEFETLVDTAHEHGLRVILDIVMNHAGYNSLYDMAEYGYGTIDSSWKDTYYDFNSISNSTYHTHIDYDNNASDWAKWWGTDWIRCGVAGYTAGGGDNYTMSLAGLPDFMTGSSKAVGVPEILKTKWTMEGRLSQETSELDAYFSKTGKTRTVTNTLAYWLSTWVRDYGVDGFRCDTAKHVEYSAWNELSQTCTEALKEWRINNPEKPGANWTDDFWMTGECWDHGVYKDEYYTQGGFDSMLNFSTLGGGLVAQGAVKNTYNSFASSINTDDSFNALSFMSSHDSTLTRGNLIATGSAFLMLPGGVQVFYGDETNRPLVDGIPFDGNGGAGHSLRSDMNWESTDEAVLEHWQKVGTFRNNHVSVGGGANTDLTSTSGYAFGRTYDKNGVTDKIAGCIYAGANSDVTIDVSTLWADGQYLVNAYDQSSAVVTNGKVTFNSGANSTILIQEPDGRPLMTVTGSAEFKDSQTVTVKLEECDSAKCSIDGGNKFVVYNGSTFSIGSTAYVGDTVKVTLEATNEKGTSESTASFKKVDTVIKPTDPTAPTTPAEKDVLYVKTWDGSAPYAYVWTGESTALNGVWPGKQLTEKNSEGYYVLDLNSTESFNVVMNNGSGTQSSDITKLIGTTYLEVTNSSYATKVVSTGSSGGGGVDPVEGSVTIRVKPYGDTAPNLYVWNDDGAYNGAWPGSPLSEKDENGNYVFTVNNVANCNAIVNIPGSGQTADITSLTGDVTITITNAECTTYKLTKQEIPLSGFALLKKEARAVKAMTASDYTSQTWSAVNALMPYVDALIAQGEGVADETALATATTQLQSAKAALKIAQPKLTYAIVGQSSITGITAPDAAVTVSVNGTNYKTTSNDVSGAFTVNCSALTSASSIKIDVTRNGLASDTYTYNMSSGNVNSGVLPTDPQPPTTPVPTTAPATTAPVTTSPSTTVPATTVPVTTAPVTTVPVTTQPTTAPADTLTVNATSNVFPSASQTVDAQEETVTVSFKLSSTMKILNGQWTLNYDNTKLQFNTANNVANNVQTIMPVVGSDLVYRTNTNYIKGNFSNLNLFTFNKNSEFVTVTFNVIGTGNAKVDLQLEYLGAGYVDNSTGEVQDADYVNNGVIVDITKITGFENAAITTKTEFISDILIGDADGNGSVNIIDVTQIMKAVAEKVTLTPTQSKCADVNGDGKVNIKDATMLQKRLAGLA